ncbi:MAG: DUF2934 domain-containing protein [Acidobacteriota bacterium]|nr:DUF2934 domain-containing protein [Acidobacteriota bacterium]
MAKAGKKKAEQVISETGPNQPSQMPAAARPTAEEISERAYHIYLERGGAEGNPDDDWLQAERDLTSGS